MRHFRFAIAALLLLLSTSVQAQWQTPTDTIPVGRGAGATGFNTVLGSAGAGAKCLIDTVPPTFGTCPGVGAVSSVFGRTGAVIATSGDYTFSLIGGTNAVNKGGTGAVIFTANGPLLGNGTSPLIQGTRSGNTTVFGTTSGALTSGRCVQLDASGNLIAAAAPCAGSAGTVTSVGFTGGLISVGTPTTTPALTVAGTSGGVPYFSSASTWASSAALAANALVIGGGAGTAPATTATGAGVLTFLGTASSANLAAAVTDETGSGPLVFGTSPALTTPSLGAATATSVVASGLLQAGTTLGISTDVLLNRDAANTLALRNGTNAQIFNLYGTFTDASNYDRLKITKTAGGSVNITTEAAGTGTASTIAFGVQTIFNAGINVQAGDAQLPAGNLIFWSGRSVISSPSDGVLRLTNNAQTSFNRLQLGGTTSSFPALKANAAELDARLADDSAFANFGMLTALVNGDMRIIGTGLAGWSSKTQLYGGTTDGVLVLTNAAQTDFGRLQFGGTTSSFPALKRSTTAIQARLADDSAYTSVQLSSVLYVGSSSGSTTLQAAAVAGSGTLTLPASETATLITGATAATLTNKTLDTAGTGNIFKIAGTTITAISGNTATVATTSGVLTNGNCVSIGASGNLVDAGGACTTGGGGGTVNSGTVNQLAYYASTGTAVSGLATANNGVLVTDGSGVPSVSSTLPAHTLGGTVSGGGNQVNNVIIGTTTPLAVFSTSLAYSTTLTGTSANANALAIGLNGATNPALNVDASTASSVTGIKVKSAAAAAGVALSVISSGTNENLTIDAKGSGTVTIGGTSTGAIALSRALTYGGVTLNNAVTGTGNMALSTSPVFTTPTLGAATATTINGNTFTTGSYVLTGTAGKTFTFSNTLTMAGTDSTTMTFPSVSATIPRTVASGAKALATSAIGSAACSSAQTDTATGTVTTDAVEFTFAADPTAATGYIPSVNGMLAIIPYVTADTVNFKVCNNTVASITPGAVTVNWRVVR